MVENTPGFRGCVSTRERTAGPSTALRSGRDDNSIAGVKYFTLKLLRTQHNCHPDRSEAQWRDLRLLQRSRSSLSVRVAILPESNRPPLVIPTVVYPDFLLRAASDGHVCGSPLESRMQILKATGLDRKSGGA